MSPGQHLKHTRRHPFFSLAVGAQIPTIAAMPPSTCTCKKFALDALAHHVSTCTTHSGSKKSHDWEVEQIAALFHTTHKVKTQEVVMIGQD